MLLSLLMNEGKHHSAYGCLYIVATPIGNRKDITLRALDVLKQVDWIAAEDTRTSGRFLSAHGISGDLISYHDHNEDERTPELIKKLKKGDSIALLSNAGTPSVSDPGYRLVKTAIENYIDVIPIPGASAAIAALSVSGLPTDSFIFIGFPARKKGKRLNQLKILANDTRTVVFYESPKRIIQFMEEIIASFGDRYGVLAREMTKMHEEFIRGRMTEIIENLKQRPTVKGEITLIVMGHDASDISKEDLQNEIEDRLKTGKDSMSDLAKYIAEKYGVSRNIVYEMALKLKKKQ